MDRLVVVVIDHNGAELDRRTIPDPRVVRLEVPDANGLLSSVPMEHETTELLFSVQDLPGVSVVKIYEPQSSDHGLSLMLVGELSLRTP